MRAVCLLYIFQAQHRDAFVQERYGQYDLSDPFLALQRDSESEERQNMLAQPHTHLRRRAVGPNPLAVLKLVMAHCKRMQERMVGQLAAAEGRHKKVRGNAHFQLSCARSATIQGPILCQIYFFLCLLCMEMHTCIYDLHVPY